jgi:hypothetical protein
MHVSTRKGFELLDLNLYYVYKIMRAHKFQQKSTKYLAIWPPTMSMKYEYWTPFYIVRLKLYSHAG